MKTLMIIFLAVSASSCGVKNSGKISGQAEVFENSLTHIIDVKVIKPYCITCHTTATKRNGMVSLSNLSQVAAQAINKAQSGQLANNQRTLIVPGKPAASVLYQSIASRTMPPKGRHPVPAKLTESVKEWIAAMQ